MNVESNIVEVEIKKVERQKQITIHLTVDEACMLTHILGNISGSNKVRRNFTSPLFYSLVEKIGSDNYDNYFCLYHPFVKKMMEFHSDADGV